MGIFPIALAVSLQFFRVTGDTIPTELYVPVLNHMVTEFPEHETLLNDDVLKFNCLQGGCGQNHSAGRLPADWLIEQRDAGLIQDFCTNVRGRCVRDRSTPEVTAPSAEVILTSPSVCDTGCREIVAQRISAGGPHSLVRRYYLYRLERSDEKWVMVDFEFLTEGYIDLKRN